MTTTTDYKEQLSAMVVELADNVWHTYCRNVGQKLYWYYTEAKYPDYGQMVHATDCPVGDAWEDWQLVCAEHFPRNMTRDQLVAWILPRMDQLPICGE